MNYMAKKINRQVAVDEILKRLSEGQSLRSILPEKKRPAHLPSHQAFTEWLKDDAQLVAQYVRAREAGADVKVEEMEDIAKKAKTMTQVHQARLIIDTRKWQLSKQFPKKYGDSIKVEQTVTETKRPMFGENPLDDL